MLTYTLKKTPGTSLYESLYRCIRSDILSGVLAPGQKLPSKRALAAQLDVSKITVEAAYEQLLAEGFLYSREKVGYFVEQVRPGGAAVPVPAPAPAAPARRPLPDARVQGFPFSVWSRLQREVVLDLGEQLLLELPNRGAPELRSAIARHLQAFRGMQVDPEHILIGAGSDFLYNLIIQLLGRDRPYAVEEPGYGKIRKIYAAGGVRCLTVPLDARGLRPDCLGSAGAVHISPNHHFPTGLVMPMERRRELLAWAREAEGWIIEDDYDSEFRFAARPMSALQTLDPERVIYINSFSRSLAPSIRISYMVLPGALMDRFQRELGFYSCTVPSFEQYTLARFLDRGHFEKHINRMRRFYAKRREAVLAAIRESPIGEKMRVLEQDAGLHFLLKLDTEKSDREIEEALKKEDVPFQLLSRFYGNQTEDLHTLVVSYAGVKEETIKKALQVLEKLL